MIEPVSGEIIVRGSKIRCDDQGRVSLNDIYAAAGSPKNKEAFHWKALPSTKELIDTFLKKTIRKSDGSDQNSANSVIYAKAGIGTFADPVIALAYAKYLSPDLHIEVNEVFLRYGRADIAPAPFGADE